MMRLAHILNVSLMPMPMSQGDPGHGPNDAPALASPPLPCGVCIAQARISKTYTINIRFTYFLTMGIVKISDQMHENLRLASNALSRSINSQAEHWMRVGMLAEMYPDLDHREICQMLVRAELAGGLDVALAARGELDKVATTAPARAGKQH